MGSIVWARLVDYHKLCHTLTFLTPLPKKYKRTMTLKFGVKEVGCIIDQLVIKRAEDPVDSSYEDPAIVYVSKGLTESLGIPVNLTFQLLIEEDSITLGPTIGLLLGNKPENYTPDFMTENYSDRMAVYSETGGLIIAYSPMAVDWKRLTVKGLMYRTEDNTWVPVEAAIPKVTYRRHILQRNFGIFRGKLIKNNGILFNSIRYSKWRVYKILAKNPIFRSFLPETILLKNYAQFMEFIKRFNQVILKPKSGSRGKGIMIIKLESINDEDYFQLSDYSQSSKTAKHSLYSRKTLHSFLDKLLLFESGKYICQRYVDLATIKGCYFDIRVLMQKGLDMNWHSTGIECRIADPKKEITNLAAGGKAVSIQEAVLMLDQPVALSRLSRSILKLSDEFCFWMDNQKSHHYGEFGLDVGLGKDGHICLIEANFRPGYKGFKTFDQKVYFEIGYQPIRYAAALQRFSVIPDQKTN